MATASPIFIPGSVATMQPHGRTRLPTLGQTPTAIPLPSVAVRRILRTMLRSTADIIFTDTLPSATDGSDGFYIKADEVFVYDGDPAALVLRTAAASGTADVRLAFYGT